jgi:hypothetical protein
MTYRSHQTNKKTGVTYVYDVVSVWHKDSARHATSRYASEN